ncbi:hypothetical protein N8014_05700 [Pseudomonadota bacterium]|nr:hypothetical protein [Pseudomonadota bacterium]
MISTSSFPISLHKIASSLLFTDATIWYGSFFRSGLFIIANNVFDTSLN